MSEGKLDTMILMLREQNGAVAKLLTDVYGSEERSIKGIKPQVDQHTLDIAATKSVGKALLTFLTLIGAGNVYVLVVHLTGG